MSDALPPPVLPRHGTHGFLDELIASRAERRPYSRELARTAAERYALVEALSARRLAQAGGAER